MHIVNTNLSYIQLAHPELDVKNNCNLAILQYSNNNPSVTEIAFALIFNKKLLCANLIKKTQLKRWNDNSTMNKKSIARDETLSADVREGCVVLYWSYWCKLFFIVQEDIYLGWSIHIYHYYVLDWYIYKITYLLAIKLQNIHIYSQIME